MGWWGGGVVFVGCLSFLIGKGGGGDIWQYDSELGKAKGIIEVNNDNLWGVGGLLNQPRIYVGDQEAAHIVVIDLLVIWFFLLTYQTKVKRQALIVYCHRHQVYVALKKLKCFHSMGVALLKNIMSLCRYWNVALIPFFDPLD